jgi:hypothetical protein
MFKSQLPRRILIASVLMLNLSIIGPSYAIPIKDQAFEPASPDTIPTIFDGLRWAQTFTVGISGTLSRVDVLFAQLFSQQPDDLLITIFDTSSGAPTTALTPSAHLSPSIVPIVQHPSDFASYAYLSTSFSLPVTAGHTLAIVASTGDTSQYYWAGVFSGGFPGGQLYENDGFGWNPSGTEDQAFRTFVEPRAGVPELPSPAFMVIGLVGLLLTRSFTMFLTYNIRKRPLSRVCEICWIKTEQN